MNLSPSKTLTHRQTLRGLDLVIKEGLTSEAMSTFTGGTFLMAMALLLGASNFQIGLLAALPTMTNAFQMLTTWLLQKYNNRRVIAVIANGLARFPLLLIGFLPLIYSKETSVATILLILFFHYFFGSIAGASWNSWMKDLVPGDRLGSYFSKRGRMAQTLNLCLSLFLALLLDHIKKVQPEFELTAYSLFFIAGGILGLFGTWLLARTPEPVSYLPKENLLKLYKKPLKDTNYRSLLIFQSAWTFALNIATPFFTVYMMRSLNLQLATIIALGMCAQLAGIFSLKMWGNYSDQTSNKTIIRIAAPLYILCVLAWPLAGMLNSLPVIILVVLLINIIGGFSSAGINLALTNMAMKLAPQKEAVVYLSAKNVVVGLVGATSPVLGGFLADFFTGRSFAGQINWNGPDGTTVVRLFDLHNLGFLFIIGGILAIFSLKILSFVKEEGEMPKKFAVAKIRKEFRTKFKSRLQLRTLVNILMTPVHIFDIICRKVRISRIFFYKRRLIR